MDEWFLFWHFCDNDSHLNPLRKICKSKWISTAYCADFFLTWKLIVAEHAEKASECRTDFFFRVHKQISTSTKVICWHKWVLTSIVSRHFEVSIMVHIFSPAVWKMLKNGKSKVNTAFFDVFNTRWHTQKICICIPKKNGACHWRVNNSLCFTLQKTVKWNICIRSASPRLFGLYWSKAVNVA